MRKFQAEALRQVAARAGIKPEQLDEVCLIASFEQKIRSAKFRIVREIREHNRQHRLDRRVTRLANARRLQKKGTGS